MSFANVCRVCLGKYDELTNLRTKLPGENKTLVDSLNFVINIDMKLEDGLPDKICKNCETVLDLADIFKQRCLQSEAILSQQCVTLDKEKGADESRPILYSNCQEEDTSLAIMPCTASPSPLGDEMGNEENIYELLKNKIKMEIVDDGTISESATLDAAQDCEAELSKSEEQHSVTEDTNDDHNADYSGEEISLHFEDEDATSFTTHTEDDELEMFKCSDCDKSFVTAENLKVHYGSHIAKLPSLCPDCSGTVTAGVRDILHSDGNSGSCDLCSRTFNVITSTEAAVSPASPMIETEDEHDDDNTDLMLNKETERHKPESNLESTHEARNMSELCTEENAGNAENMDIIKKQQSESELDQDNDTESYKAETNIEGTHEARNMSELCTEENAGNAVNMDIIKKQRSESELDQDNDTESYKAETNIEGTHDTGNMTELSDTDIGDTITCATREQLKCINNTTANTTKEILTCGICEYTTNKIRNLNSHLRAHAAEKWYSCDLCPYLTVNSTSYEYHLKKCQSDKPYCCKICQKKYGQKFELNKHIITHTGDKTYCCDICQKKFILKTALANHVKTHDKSYSYDTCQETFTQKRNLRSHVTKHHRGVNPNICLKELGQKPSLDNSIQCTEENAQHTENTVLIKKQQSDSELDQDKNTESYKAETNIEDTIETGNVTELSDTDLGDTITCATQDQSECINNTTSNTPEEILTCGICEYTTNKIRNLNSHLRAHAATTKRYSCDLCPYLTLRSTDYKDHVNTHIDVTSESELDVHVGKHTGKLTYSCNLCQKEFGRRDHYIYHVRSHTGKKSYSCKICQKKYVLKFELKNHLKTHTGEKSYNCDICQTKFIRKTSLASHIKKHNMNNKFYTCHTCQETFTRRHLLRYHVKKHHTGVSPNICLKELGQKHSLEDNGKESYKAETNIEGNHEAGDTITCASQEQLKCINNTTVNTTNEILTCGICEYTTNKIRNLNSHLRAHAAEKWYSCDFCPYLTVNASGYEYHLKKCQSDKPYCCKLCQKKYGQQFELNKHMITHTGDKIYCCDICQKKFILKTALANHVKTHDKSYSCDTCQETFTQKRHLRSHVTKHHPGVNPNIFLKELGQKPSSDNSIQCTEENAGHTENTVLIKKQQSESELDQDNDTESYKAETNIEGTHDTGNTTELSDTDIGDTITCATQEQSECIKNSTSSITGEILTCDICEYTTTKISSLNSHSRTHRDKPYGCDICQKKFGQKIDLDKHVETHTADKLFCCDICQKKFSRKNALAMHVKIHTQFYSCDTCQKTFTLKRLLRRHVIKHEKTAHKPFCCDICQKKFVRKNALGMHVKTHMQFYSCDTCQETFTQKHHLRHHIIKHNTTDKPLCCDICQKKFIRKNALTNHVKSHMNDKSSCDKLQERGKTTKLSDKDILTCNICEYTTTSVRFLNSHLRAHAAMKRYSCEFCSYLTIDFKRYTEHITLHTGDKPYCCHLCPKKFSRKTNLSLHVRTHTGEKPFCCDICRRPFGRKDQLKKHIRLHTGKKPYSCNICRTIFGQKDNLKTHLSSHTGKSLYSCKICQNKYRNKVDLELHVKTHTIDSKSYFCDICQKGFRRKRHLRDHVTAHTGQQSSLDYHNKTQCTDEYTCSTENSDVIKMQESELDFSENKDTKCYKTETNIDSTHEAGNTTELSNTDTVEEQLKCIDNTRVNTPEEILTCGICEYTTTQMRRLNSHLRAHAAKKRYSCNRCPYLTIKYTDYRYHLRTHRQRQPSSYKYCCNICQKKFSQNNHLEVHVRTEHTGEKTYTCKICHKEFGRISQYKTHVRTHTGNNPYSSQKKYAQKLKLKKRFKTHTDTGEKSYYCNTCQKKFIRKVMLAVHVKTHMNLKTYSCNTCLKKFQRERNFRLHVKNCHTDVKPVKKKYLRDVKPNICLKEFGPEPSLDFIRTLCTYEYSCNTENTDLTKNRESDLELDKDKETKSCKAESNIEGTHETGDTTELSDTNIGDTITCATQEQLKYINNTTENTYEAILTCGICEYTTFQMSRLNSHLIAHAATKRYSCDLCPYLTLNSAHYQRHLSTHRQSEKSYCCDICQRKFIRKNALTGHIKTHMNVKSYSCDKCQETFAQKRHLQSHVTKHHTGVNPNTCLKELSQKPSLDYTETIQCTEENARHTENTDLIKNKQRESELDQDKDTESYKAETNIEGTQDTGDTTELSDTDIGVQEQSECIKNTTSSMTGEILTCDICEYTTTKISSLNSHLRAHAATKRYSCDLCSYSTINYNCFKIHVNAHKGDNVYCCDICDKTFSRKNILVVHIRKHIGDMPYSCYLCQEKFTAKNLLEQHVSLHNRRDKAYSCHLCEKKFNLRRQLQRHVIIHGVKRHSCKKCDKKFHRKEHLDKHLKTHKEGDNEPYSCSICRKTFTSRDMLDCHIKAHTDQPYSCNLCGEKFVTKSQLTNHQARTHEGKAYSCNICQRKFTRRDNLYRHVRYHIREKRFSCNICQKKFYEKRSLNDHIGLHTGERRYFCCHKCDRKYTSRFGLKTHIRNKHQTDDDARTE